MIVSEGGQHFGMEFSLPEQVFKSPSVLVNISFSVRVSQTMAVVSGATRESVVDVLVHVLVILVVG